MIRRRLLLGSSLAAAGTLAAPSILRAQGKTVKMGCLRLVHSMPPFFYEKFAPEGTKIEIVMFDSPTDGKNAVVTKSVDFGTLASPPRSWAARPASRSSWLARCPTRAWA